MFLNSVKSIHIKMKTSKLLNKHFRIYHFIIEEKHFFEQEFFKFEKDYSKFK